MKNNTVLFVVFSAVTIFLWYFVFAPKQEVPVQQNAAEQTQSTREQTQNNSAVKYDSAVSKENLAVAQESFTVETGIYKAVFTNVLFLLALILRS